MIRRVAPCVVKLKRKGRMLYQGCDLYIGNAWEKQGWKLPQSKWYNDFRVGKWSNTEDMMQQYETHVRSKPELMASLDELTGKVLGCWCKMPHETQRMCHGDILIKLWKEAFPDHEEVKGLWHSHFHENGLDEGHLKVKRQKKKVPSKKKRKPSDQKGDDKDDEELVVRPKKVRKTPQKKYRTQVTNPEGARFGGATHPWPKIKHEWNSYTIWIDEAGMGPWAGPLHVAGTVLLPGFNLQGIHDSKILKQHEREALYEKLLLDHHIVWHVESVPNTKIDELKLGEAWRYGIRRVISSLKQRMEREHPDMKITQVILDGNKPVDNTDIPVTTAISADRLYAGVAAASILAKVSRDRLMSELAPKYPKFQDIFAKGHGYRHSETHDILIRDGIFTDLHRKSFNPLRSLLEQGIVVRHSRKPNSAVKVLTLEGPKVFDMSDESSPKVFEDGSHSGHEEEDQGPPHTP